MNCYHITSQAGDPWLGYLVSRLVEEREDSTSTSARASSSISTSTDTSTSISGLPGVGLRRGGLVVGPMSRCVLAQYLLPPLLLGVEADVCTPSSSTTANTTTSTSPSGSGRSSASSPIAAGSSGAAGGGAGAGNDRWGYLPQALQDACTRLQQQQQQQPPQPLSFGASPNLGLTPGPGPGASPGPFGYRALALVSQAGRREACGGATGTEATTLALLCCLWLQVIKIADDD